MRARTLALAIIVVLAALSAFAAISPAATSTDQKQNERIAKLEKEIISLNEKSVKTNERVSQLVTRVNSLEAHDLGQDPKISTLESEVARLGNGSGGEEPPAEEPPAEEPEEEPAHEEPTQTLHCFSNPAACGFPAPSNTGTSGTLTPSGSISATTAGQVIKNLAVTGTINVTAPNVTIENVKVTQNTTCGGTNTCGNYAIRTTASGTVIKHVETATVAGDTCEHDIRNAGGSVVIEDSYLHACDSNLYDAGTATLIDSYGLGKLDISEDHVENVYFEGTFTARHSTLLNPIGQTAVVFGNSGGGTDVTNCSNHLTLEGNLFAGGGYTIYPCAHAAQTGSSVVRITGNHFARCLTAETNTSWGGHPCKGGPDANGYYPKSGEYGMETNYFGTQTWSGNVWDDSGVSVNSSGN